ncbi:MAG: DUF368 domain-containing protein [Marinilabiliaceae bacterium]|nr:DUF368 domain-containing protein [Marinilabiliaceae bacterium]
MNNRTIKDYIKLAFKGMGMGAANVIPGVSGGTIALITGIFEELIDSVKSFNLEAVRLLLKGQFKSFSQHVNLAFLVSVFTGIAISILSLAKILEFLFEKYPVFVWAFFFGLIIGSVYFVGKTVEKWKTSVVISLIIGSAIAIGVSIINSASENDGMLYLVLCGAIAMCSMILPGLSGSFVLILLGNYELVMIKAVSGFKVDILLPVAGGAVAGLIMFSHLLSWVFKSFRDQTIALLTGFIAGSLAILWPWQTPVFKADELGNYITKINGERIIIKYAKYLPESLSAEVIFAAIFALCGIVIIWLVETYAGSDSKKV